MAITNLPETPLNASVNRVQLVELPGLPVDPGVLGKRAYHLLSTPALIRYARAYPALALPELPLDEAQTRLTLPRRVAEALESADPAARAAAREVARRLGRNLGYILLALRRGDAANRAARLDWGAPEWARWARICQVWVGGGLASGAFGALLVTEARALLAELGYGDARLERAAYGSALALVGAARYVPAEAAGALCCDFGHTLVKRAVVYLADGALTRLELLAPVPIPWRWENTPQSSASIAAVQVREFVVETLARSVAEACARGSVLSPEVLVSVAAYVQGGRLLGNGVYAQLQQLAADVGALVGAGLTPFRVHFLHDGAAAAAVYAGAPAAAVIVIGTALGIGFPPESAAGLRPLAADFAIVNG